MFICNSWYNLENSDQMTLAAKNRVINNPQYVPRVGEKVFLDHMPAPTVAITKLTDLSFQVDLEQLDHDIRILRFEVN
jgi:hypothetical protein